MGRWEGSGEGQWEGGKKGVLMKFIFASYGVYCQLLHV